MQTVTSSRLGVVAAIAAVVLGAGGVVFAGTALATPPAKTATQQDDCWEDEPGYDTVRPPTGSDDCDDDEGDDDGDHGVPCPTDSATTEPVVILKHKKPRDHETPYCPTESPTTEPPMTEPPTETATEPPTPTVTETSPEPTETTPEPTETTPAPEPCDEDSTDDDCGVITEPPAFTG